MEPAPQILSYTITYSGEAGFDSVMVIGLKLFERSVQFELNDKIEVRKDYRFIVLGFCKDYAFVRHLNNPQKSGLPKRSKRSEPDKYVFSVFKQIVQKRSAGAPLRPGNLPLNEVISGVA